MSDPYLGRLLANRYQLVEMIGKGAMGRVYQAKDTLLGGVPVAVKFLVQALMNDKMRERFQREARACAQLGQKSMHIVRVMDYGVYDEDAPFYVMEYLQGESLANLINSQPMSLGKLLSLVRQICLGLQCAHQGILIEGELCPIIHRDIKPSNILVCQDDTVGELVKILDFGIAKILQSNSEQTSSFMGTLAYSSPEQMEGKSLDNRADIYSLGVLVYELITGRLPLEPQAHTFPAWYKAHHSQIPAPLSQVPVRVQVPPALEKLVMTCLAKSPTARPQNMSEILAVLASLEQRFGGGFQRSELTNTMTAAPEAPGVEAPVEPVPAPQALIDQACQKSTWPGNKPLAEIVFPKLLTTEKFSMASVWVMLSRQEIENRALCTRYNQFLFVLVPHPVILWITVLYNLDYGPRWLPCYLDLKNPRSRDIVSVLHLQGEYRLLLFALETPGNCSSVMTAKVSASQQPLLGEWIKAGQISPDTDHSHVSRVLLKSEFEKLKPKILQKLELSYKERNPL